MTHQSQKTVLVILVAIWAASFFLPALRGPGSTSGDMMPGYLAAFLSAICLRVGVLGGQDWGLGLYLGSFCLANLFMVALPFALRRIRRGKGALFLKLMVAWDLLTFSYVLSRPINREYHPVSVGWWMWEISLFGTTALLFQLRSDALARSSQ